MAHAFLALSLVVAALPFVSSAEPFLCDREFAARHGITCHLSFEGTGVPQFSRTGAKPTYMDSLDFVSGVTGRAVLLRQSRERELGKVKGRASGLNFDASGLLYGERGAIAFWFQPQWDGSDPGIRSGSHSTGPSLISVASVEPTYYGQFVRMQIKGGSFYIWVVDAEGSWHGPNYGAQVKTWRRQQWRHLALTWNCEKGVRFFDNGTLMHDTWGKERWRPATPRSIGIGSDAPSGRPQVVRAADMAMDDLFLFDHAIDTADVQALMTGNYAALGIPSESRHSEAERQAREQQFGLGASSQRMKASMAESGWEATLALLEIREIATDFMEGRFLSDGLTTRQFHLAQGGLTFTRDVTLSLADGLRANYAVLAGRPTPSSVLRTGAQSVPLEAEPDGMQRVHLTPPAATITLSLQASSVLGECQLFHVSDGVSPSRRVHPFTLEEDPSSLGLAATPLWRDLSGLDRRSLLQGQNAPPSCTVMFPAYGKLHLISDLATATTGIAAVRLRLRVRNPHSDVTLAIKLHDPFEPQRFRLLVDLAVPRTDIPEPILDLDLRVPGLVQGEGQRLWLELVADRPLDVILGQTGSGMALESRPTDEVADAFARSYLRFLNKEFRSRMSHNFMYTSRGVQTVNPLTLGLAHILRIAPDNEQARTMHHWARLSPWPAWEREPEGPASAPRWARLQRAVLAEALGTIHWWIDHRQDASGFVIGNANMWNDVTKLFNEFAVFALVTGDEKLTIAMEKYLDAHYATGRMERGYSKPFTDTVHSQEEASYLLPTLAFLRYGDPRQIERLMENAANIPYWTGLTAPEQRHFKSNFYTATQMKTEGRFGHDTPINAATLVPATFLAWYNGTPDVKQWLVEYANAWCGAATQQTTDKGAGLPPTYVDFATGKLGPFQHAYFQTLGFHLLAVSELTGQHRYLALLEALLGHSGARGVYTLGLNAPEWHRRSGIVTHDAAIMEQVNAARTAIEADSFYQRGVESADVHMIMGHMITGDAHYLELALHNAWRNNARARKMYTEVDPDTDRVYPWGRVVLPWMMCGGNGLNARASAPLPSIAVSWENTENELAAWVREWSSSALRVSLYNFASPRDVIMRTWGLGPGVYELICSTEGAGSRPSPVRRVTIRRGRPITVTLPARQLATLTLTRTSPYELPLSQSDAAISATEAAANTTAHSDGSWLLSVPVHNLGTSPLPLAQLTVTDAGGRLIAREGVPGMPAPTDLKPRVEVVDLVIPRLARFPITIRVTGPEDEITKVNNSCVISARMVSEPATDPADSTRIPGAPQLP